MKPARRANCEACHKWTRQECPHSYWMEDINERTNHCVAWEEE